MYEDELVCILKPDVKKGIIIWTHYVQPLASDRLCMSGLKTAHQLHLDGVNLDRDNPAPYIFFKAPFKSSNIDYSSVNTEISCSYGKTQIEVSQIVYIRVDPNKTYVFSSELRDHNRFPELYRKVDTFIINSKKLLSEYLKIIENNIEIIKKKDSKHNIYYNLFSSMARLFPLNLDPPLPFDSLPIERNSEILVSIPHLTPDFYVLCT